VLLTQFHGCFGKNTTQSFGKFNRAHKNMELV